MNKWFAFSEPRDDVRDKYFLPCGFYALKWDVLYIKCVDLMIYMKIRCVKSLLKMNIIVLFLILLGFNFPLYNVI